MIVNKGKGWCHLCAQCNYLKNNNSFIKTWHSLQMDILDWLTIKTSIVFWDTQLPKTFSWNGILFQQAQIISCFALSLGLWQEVTTGVLQELYLFMTFQGKCHIISQHLNRGFSDIFSFQQECNCFSHAGKIFWSELPRKKVFP